jgi:hypothetical protein
MLTAPIDLKERFPSGCLASPHQKAHD